MRTLLGIVGAFLAVIIVTALCTSWIIVYVHDRDEGFRVLVPAPIVLADMALRIGEVYAAEPDLPPEAREALQMLPPLVEELVRAPDFELLRVEEPGLDVTIRKVGEQFNVSVVDDDQTVRIQVPLQALKRAAHAMGDGNLRIGELTGMLRGVSRTELVNVSMPDQDVRVWVW